MLITEVLALGRSKAEGENQHEGTCYGCRNRLFPPSDCTEPQQDVDLTSLDIQDIAPICVGGNGGREKSQPGKDSPI